MDNKRDEIRLICDGKIVTAVRMVDGKATNTHTHKVSSLFEVNENMEFCAALGYIEGVVPEEELSDALKVRDIA